MSFELEILKLGAEYSLEDAYDHAVCEAVIWHHEDTLKTKTLDQFDLESSPGEYTHLRGFQVTSDPEACFNSRNRRSTGWVIEIYPIEGDYLLEDSNSSIQDKFGGEVLNKVLITSRKSLTEGKDYDFIKELCEDDLIEDTEDEEYGDFDEYHGYGDLDEDED